MLLFMIVGFVHRAYWTVDEETRGPPLETRSETGGAGVLLCGRTTELAALLVQEVRAHPEGLVVTIKGNQPAPGCVRPGT